MHLIMAPRCLKFMSRFPRRQCLNLFRTVMNKTATDKYLDSLVNYATHFDEKFLHAHVVTLLKEYEECQSTVNELLKLSELPQLSESAKEDISKCHAQQESLKERIIDFCVPQSKEDKFGSVLEISAGVGGQEAMLFSQELLQLYRKYSLNMGWAFKLSGVPDETDIGGLRTARAVVEGPQGTYGWLKFEAGIHRVQRVPITERTGRMHTSTVSVYVGPQYDDVEIELDPKELRVECIKSSSAGGQNQNTTSSAVRITHLPTKTIVRSEEERFQNVNYQSALKKLRRILYLRQYEKDLEQVQARRRLQIGTKERSLKIRTYNFLHDRVTDHRLKHTVTDVASFLKGLEPFQETLLLLKRAYKEELFLEYLQGLEELNSIRSNS